MRRVKREGVGKLVRCRWGREQAGTGGGEVEVEVGSGRCMWRVRG